MHGKVPGQAEVADLIVQEARSLHPVHEPIELGGGVRVRGRHHGSLGHLVRQGGARLHGEAIGAQVRHAVVQRDGELLVPFGPVHARQSVDQVDGPAAEPGLRDQVDAAQGVGRGVRAAHEAQPVLAKALRAQAQAGDAQLPPGRQPPGGDVIGVGLQGHLRLRVHGERPTYPIEQRLQFTGFQQAGGAAAEVDRGERTVVEAGSAFFQLPRHGFQHPILRPQAGAEVEVTVGAGPAAEGDVEVEAGHGAGRGSSGKCQGTSIKCQWRQGQASTPNMRSAKVRKGVIDHQDIFSCW